jgi:hypothetical protein
VGAFDMRSAGYSITDAAMARTFERIDCFFAAMAVVVIAACSPPRTTAEPAPAPTDGWRARLALASSVCAAAIRTAKDGGAPAVGCRSCPPFVEDAARPDGRTVVDPNELFPIELTYAGAFTRPGADEIAAVFEGCESHAENWGGTLVVARTGGTFRVVDYVSGVHPNSCVVYRMPDAHDALVCLYSDAHQTIATQSLYLYDFATHRWDVLVSVSDDSRAICVELPSEVVRQNALTRLRMTDVDRDGRLDIAVDVHHRRTPISSELARAVAERCKGWDGTSDPPDTSAVVGEPSRDVIELLFDGKTFRPSGRTAALLKEL